MAIRILHGGGRTQRTLNITLDTLGDKNGIVAAAFTAIDAVDDSPLYFLSLGLFIAIGFAWLLGFGATLAEPALNALGLLAAGWCATTLPDARLYGFAAADYFFLFGMAAVAFVGDVKMIFGRQISNKQRIAQHLVRMCIGFFIAAGSAFTGPGASAFPEAVQDSGLLSLPELTIILLMLFWLWKTLRQPRPVVAG